MTAYEFFKVPSWVFPTAAVAGPDGRQASVTHIEWNARVPEVFYRYDGEAQDRRMLFAEFCGRCRPLWDADGNQRSGTGGEVRSKPLLNAFAWSNRAINIIKRERWDWMTAGKFIEEISRDRLRMTHGAGKGIVGEFVGNFAAAGLEMRRDDIETYDLEENLLG